MKIHIVLVIIISLFSELTWSGSELKIPLHASLISLDPGAVQDASSLFISRQVNCQLVRSQGSNFILVSDQGLVTK